ncbi:hypothetical protein OHS58_18065 [Amycolatopsis sp. NBC_00348]|uniref:hypothetical protein n=1 Tax=Amycolatopsis sp. NBC_00348 TaxID=2975956 RepID=UPI002E2677D4
MRAYQRGDGTSARIALENTDPEQPLTRLLTSMLGHAVPPSTVRDLVQKTSAEARFPTPVALTAGRLGVVSRGEPARTCSETSWVTAEGIPGGGHARLDGSWIARTSAHPGQAVRP